MEFKKIKGEPDAKLYMDALCKDFKRKRMEQLRLTDNLRQITPYYARKTEATFFKTYGWCLGALNTLRHCRKLEKKAYDEFKIRINTILMLRSENGKAA